ncbi:site-2 protease family protein [Aneurinibacillus aneurinilyticus]|uniref:site-2 protease family protein n=1 Tax=Aneurinibacillus aneurinilyticus TaxID=1391 RepID=UPI002E1AFE3F|nr:site-2 protease family protein [Aneurinibacillus aneurinilyticus]
MAEIKKKKRGWGAAGGLLGFLALFGGKLKFLLPLLKMGKFGATIWTMVLSIGAYMLIYPWTFALGLVMMLFIHEMGHVWAAKRKNLPVSAPAFLPFLGALIMMKKQPKDAETEAYVALGGPLLGTLGAVVVLLLGIMTGYPVLYAIAMIGFFLNLINLLPIHPLDGGRIVTAISRWLWLVGLIGGLVVIVYLKAIIFLIFWGIFAWELYSKYVRKKKKDKDGSRLKMEHALLWIPVRSFEEKGLFIPATEHRRALPFMHVGDVEKKQDMLIIGYPGIEETKTFNYTSGLVHDVQLVMTEVVGEQVKMSVEMKVEPYEEEQGMIRDDKYYEVSPRTRWVYGLAYFGLAITLGLLMVYTSVQMPQIPLAG